MSQYLIFLAIIPLSCLQLTKIFNMNDRWFYSGLSLGLVIAPLSYGLQQFAYVPFIGGLLGTIGLVVNVTHGPVGYFCLAGTGFIDTGILLSASHLVMINLVNAVVFACSYGMMGYTLDRKLNEESVRAWSARY